MPSFYNRNKNQRNYLDDSESLIISIFLDILIQEVMKEPSLLVPYTEEMNQEISFLLSDVTIDE